MNPYYTAQQGLGVGPVNINPLFSFQTGTKDNGELAIRPLVNFHLTPNGCGVLGCDKGFDDIGSFPHSMLKAITDPFKLFGGGGGDAGHGISADYTAPKPSYGAPEYGYSAPQPDYGAPNPSYGAPSPSYGAPSPSYGAPSPSYGAPSPSYGAPSAPQYPDYGAVVIPAQRFPQAEYSAPKPTYNPPKPTYDGSSSNNHAEQSTGGQTHFHHHYYHQQDLLLPEDQYGREDSNNNPLQRNFTDSSNRNYLATGSDDSEVFKRHTVPDSAGFLPINLPSGQSNREGAPPASGSSGFKFPRARSLEAGEEKKPAEEVIEPRSNGGKRRRRSPDGVGHHHGGGGSGTVHQHPASITTDTVGTGVNFKTLKI